MTQNTKICLIGHSDISSASVWIRTYNKFDNKVWLLDLYDHNYGYWKLNIEI